MRSFRGFYVPAAVVAVSILMARVAHPEDAPEAAESAQRAASLEELDQRVRILERRLELEREAAEAKTRESPVLTAGKDGISLRSADGAFGVRFKGYLHADGRFFFEDEERPNVDTFLIRRARPIFEATAFRIFDLRIMPDFGEGRTVLQDAYLDARLLDELKLRIGKFKEPFGIERLQSATDMRFIERGLPNNLVPNRDVGGQLYGDLLGKRLNYAVGIFNGVPDGGSGDIDVTGDKDFAGRVFLLPFAGSEDFAFFEGLGIGIAGTVGNQEGALPTLRTTGQAAFFTYAAGARADGSRWRISPQAHFYRGRFGLLAEYVRSTQDVVLGAVTETLTNEAWQVQLNWVLTGEDAGYKSVDPRHPFDARAGNWGAVELVARVSSLRVDKDAFPVLADPRVSASDALAVGGGVNWYLNRAVKLAVDYEWSEFDDGAADFQDREDEHVLLLRAQIAF